jgi:hypothetical protein
MPQMTLPEAMIIAKGFVRGSVFTKDALIEALTVLLQSVEQSREAGEEEITAEEKRVLAKLGLPIIEAIEWRDYVHAGKILVSLDVTRNKATPNLVDKDCIASMLVKAFNEKYHNP